VEREFIWLYLCCKETNHIERPARQTIPVIHHAEPETVLPRTRGLLAQLAWDKSVRPPVFPGRIGSLIGEE
jgi:hypothetical protein